MNEERIGHRSVLLDEVIKLINPKSNEIYFDTTFGDGGYAKKILDACDCKVIAIDRDPNVKERAREYEKKYGERFIFFNARFSQINEVMEKAKEEKINGFVFDIGVSSMQLDNANRGFSFMKDGPLDMRMSSRGLTASSVVNSKSVNELADIIYHYGDERNSRKIAKNIDKFRKLKEINSTLELANIVKQSFPNKYFKKHPATKTFQALRMYVNSEIEELHQGVNLAVKHLKQYGKLCVVSFHSIEDRLVKNFMSIIEPNSNNKKIIKPSKKEVEINPRARSAKLRFTELNNSEYQFVSINDLGFEY